MSPPPFQRTELPQKSKAAMTCRLNDRQDGNQSTSCCPSEVCPKESGRGISVTDVFALLAVTVVKATLPMSVGFILLRQWRKWRSGKLRGISDVVRVGIRHSLRLWLTLEAYFYLHYRYQHWRLSQVDVHVAPVRQRDGLSADRRREYLERCLAALDEVSRWQLMRKVSSEPLGSGGLSRAAHLSEVGRHHARVKSADALLHRVSSLKGGFAASAEDLVRLGSCENLSSWDADEETLCLSMRRAELSGWFFFTPAERISRGNVAEWLTEYFFNGMTLEAIRQDAALSQELDDLVQRIVHWAHLDPDSPETPNPEVRCMRLTRDPLPSGHLPFWLYFFTNIVLPHITRAKLTQLGFRRYRAGSMIYWFRRAQPNASANPRKCSSGSTCDRPPLVFCHGLGVGVLPYVRFVGELRDRLPDTDIFCVDLPHIQMRPREEVPSAREVCACMGDMLEAWGYSSAHFIGHSFGTLVCAWALRYMPNAVASVSLLDPICLLLCKSDLIYNALYDWKSRNPFEDLPAWILSLLVFRELYICHTLSRNFFWNQNNLWPEDLCQVPSLVVLSGRDRLVPAHTVKGFLEATIDKQRKGTLKEVWHSNSAMPAVGAASPESPMRATGSTHALLQPPQMQSSPCSGRALTEGFEPRLRFLPDAVHGQFWADTDLMNQVLRDIVAIVRTSQ
mmetsp:Transcript_17980/g.41977  ORF Transcript_17980/g.41977 Transcript_17980/m.41977 type:complete len:677 (-) Transcript_17980:106-2136(-)